MRTDLFREILTGLIAGLALLWLAWLILGPPRPAPVCTCNPPLAMEEHPR